MLTLLIIVLIYSSTHSQKASKERVRALKVAFITERLDLSSKEAQNFWPIYNDHEETRNQLKRKERESIMRVVRDANGPDELEEAEASKLIKDYLNLEQQKILARKKLLSDLKKVISSKKVLKLIKAEMDFKKRLLKQLGERRN